MKKSAMAIGLALMVFQAVQAPGRNTSTPAIHNDFLTVQWSAATHRFSLISKLGRPFMRDVALMATNGVARIVAVRGSRFTRFGDGRAIEVTGNGWRDRVMLFSGLPFALFQSAAIRPAASTPALIHSVRAFRGTVDVGKPATRLKTLGTGGLLAPAANPGSYVWLAVADPESRHGVVLGWITENRGSGVLFSGVKGDTVQICGRIDYGNLSLGPGSTPFETLAVGDFDDARLGLEAWADAVAREHDIHLPPEPVVYCTWYSRPYGAASDEKHFAQNVAFAVTNLGPYGFSVAQIDDHWQEGISTNGPHRDFLFSNPRGPYPHGMKATADAVKALGIRPGLWFEPFAGTYYDPFFKQHGDWFVRHTDGSPYEVKWGGTCLDMTDPGARDYVSNVVYRITHEWGFEYIKIDGLWTGTATPLRYVNTGYTNDGMGDAIFHVPNTPNVQAYRSGLKLVRAVAGTNVFILGCNGPQNMRSYGPAMGIVDAMRIGPDNKATWAAMLRGPTFGSRQYFLNGRVWYNDPDPVYPRDTVPLNEARALCSWVAISGAMNTSSEWYPGLSAARLDLLRRTIPAHHLLSTRPVDLFEHDPPRIWLLTDSRVTPHRNVIGL
ncbi:MAG: alpha-galactosidase, partial [Verrucomicrobia bacterium]|nr:alpha-galactosidase [Verrucomicrobiota bacterium]